MTVTGGVTFEEMIEHYRIQASGLLAGGADVLLLETIAGHAKPEGRLDRGRAGVRGDRLAHAGHGLGHDRADGDDARRPGVDALYASVMHAPLLSVGMNCATGPEFMTDHIRTLSALAKTLISCYPNAGLPDSDGNYAETPEKLARELSRFMDEGWVNIVGGCCGTTPAHIARPRGSRGGPQAAPPAIHSKTLVSGIETARGRRGQPPGPRRRAHQRPRQPQVQAAGRRGAVRGGGRDRARPGQERSAGHRRLPPGPGPRRGRPTRTSSSSARRRWSRSR